MLLAVPIVAFPAASVNIAVSITTPASVNPFKASNSVEVIDTVLVVSISDMVTDAPKLE